MSVPSQNRSLLVDVVIPVLNEAHVLEKSVETLRAFLQRDFPYQWRLVIVDNGSTDGTRHLAEGLSSRLPGVTFLHLPEKGRGRALRQAWMLSTAHVVCYMDVDLSTDLEALPRLIGAIAAGESDVAVGSRLMKESRTSRSLKREIISRIYNVFVRLALRVPFSDAQCGFKAVRKDVVNAIVPQVEDQSWFFDTELLVLAYYQGFRIKDIPVIWREDDDSRVKIIPTAWDDIKGVFRLRRMLRKQKPGMARAEERG